MAEVVVPGAFRRRWAVGGGRGSGSGRSRRQLLAVRVCRKATACVFGGTLPSSRRVRLRAVPGALGASSCRWRPSWARAGPGPCPRPTATLIAGGPGPAACSAFVRCPLRIHHDVGPGFGATGTGSTRGQPACRLGTGGAASPRGPLVRRRLARPGCPSSVRRARSQGMGWVGGDPLGSSHGNIVISGQV